MAHAGGRELEVWLDGRREVPRFRPTSRRAAFRRLRVGTADKCLGLLHDCGRLMDLLSKALEVIEIFGFSWMMVVHPFKVMPEYMNSDSPMQGASAWS